MNQAKNNLNLARKWRPENFDQIIGQEIPIRMLKNGLYAQKLFPVYLFAGQRGCGKTSTARIFGAAINCENLNKFQENPKDNPIPCLKCNSCLSMLSANHPDFIEIDAASHTGVENVRQILEACAYMPIFGKKKIYLIDEAHMLSKAAFNAFLKILEEPPASALFILATTELQKFPQTVLSRCFQVVFKAVDNISIKKHLQNICENENVKIQEQAIDVLIQETEGSVRDAINLLERVRFSEKEISTDSLLQVLGKVSEKELFTVFETLLNKDACALLQEMNSLSLKNIDPQTLWNMLLQLCRTILWIKFEAPTLPVYFNNKEALTEIASKCSLDKLNLIMRLMWEKEATFLKTPNKQLFLEMILLQTCNDSTFFLNKNKLNNNQELNLKQPAFVKKPAEKTFQQATPPNIQSNKPEIKEEISSDNANNTNKIKKTESTTNNAWENFLTKVSELDDPFLTSTINQIKFISIDPEKNLLNVSITNNSSFLKEKIKESKDSWINYFMECFPKCSGFNFVASKIEPQKAAPRTNPPPQFNNSPKPNFTNGPQNQPQRSFYGPRAPRYNYINISDSSKWPKANLIAKYFPGKIRKVN